MFIHGFGIPMITISRTLILQNNVPKNIQGRIFSLFQIAVVGTTAFSISVVGPILEYLPVNFLFLIIGIFAASCSMIGLLSVGFKELNGNSTQILNNITVVTFASPRVGNYKWYEKFNDKLNLRHYRIINNRDLVTVVPYINYYHVGNTILLRNSDIYMKKYYQKNDFFYNWVCCSYSINDHRLENYYHKLKEFV